MEVIGIEKVDFTFKDGNRFSGYRLHLAEEIVKNGRGKKVCNEVISEKMMEEYPNVEIGSIVELCYNKFGKISKIFVISA